MTEEDLRHTTPLPLTPRSGVGPLKETSREVQEGGLSKEEEAATVDGMRESETSSEVSTSSMKLTFVPQFESNSDRKSDSKVSVSYRAPSTRLDDKAPAPVQPQPFLTEPAGSCGRTLARRIAFPFQACWFGLRICCAQVSRGLSACVERKGRLF